MSKILIRTIENKKIENELTSHHDHDLYISIRNKKNRLSRSFNIDIDLLRNSNDKIAYLLWYWLCTEQ